MQAGVHNALQEEQDAHQDHPLTTVSTTTPCVPSSGERDADCGGGDDMGNKDDHGHSN